MKNIKESIRQAVKTNLDKIISDRRHIHRHPELSFEEHKTSAFVASRLDEMGISYKKGIAGTGIIATIEGREKGKVIALRADMDGLPIQEKTGLSFASENDGVMHACGHDMHTAALLGVAKTLSELRDQWKGNVLLLFQPGEEKFPGGASMVLKEGVLKQPRPELIIGQHVLPDMPAGHAGFKPGMYMASGDEIYLTVRGKGGHAALPHTLNDTVLIASHIIVALQQLVSREVPADIPTVLSFGKIEGKGATNIIPEKVEIAGTLRTMNEEWRARIKTRIQEMASGLAQSMGASCDADIKDGYPVVFNDETATQQAMAIAREFLPEGGTEKMDIRMTAEDFGYYTQQFPSIFYRFGVGRNDHTTGELHTPRFNPDETALETATGLLSWLALNFLKTRE